MKRVNHILRSVYVLVASFLLLFGVMSPLVKAQPAMHRRMSAKHSNNVIEVKFDESAEVELQNNDFVSTTNTNLKQVNTKLRQYKVHRKQPLFGAEHNNLRATKKVRAKQGVQTPDLASYYRVQIKDGQDIEKVAAELKATPGITEAYPLPLPAPAPASPNLTAQQLHLTNAPVGLGFNSVSNFTGATGAYAKVADVEFSWNVNHEDLPKARAAGAVIPVGTPVDYFNDNRHGTQVLGVLSGAKNSYGVNGEVPSSAIRMVNVYSQEYGWDPALAITTAAARLAPGDVILLEQQVYGPNAEYMPIEWMPAVYDAIKAATASGLIVVEAAANGNVNLDDPQYGSTSFPLNKGSSGAIMVGAGAGCDWLVPRSRMIFSNYGSRVDVQGYGSCVVTTGVGDLYDGGSENTQYTQYFNGTSSASAVIAGAATSISSAYERANGKPATTALVKSLMQTYSTPQDNSNNPGNIGPMPDVYKAILAADKTAPTSPTNLTVSGTSQPYLKWTASKDTMALAGYKIYRNNTLIATIGKTATYIDKTATLKTTYTYKVNAYDKSGNISGFSNSVTFTTR